MLNAYLPPLDDETIEERVAGRLERQALLAKRTRAFSFVIGEAALRNPVGGPEPHRRQLLRLVEGGAARNVTIQALPFVGAGPGVDGPFVLLETAEHELKWSTKKGMRQGGSTQTRIRSAPSFSAMP